MDPNSIIEDGRLIDSPDLTKRVKLFKDWQQDGYGEIVVQSNVEDTRLGVQEYAISKLGVRTVELKWGQGAKDIGGEVKLKTLEKAQLLKTRGYVVLPDPFDEKVIEAFKNGTFKEFERHSRVGMVTEDGFMDRADELRKAGAKYLFLKTGAYRPADLARAVKYSSKAKIDLLTVDAAGGGTGMSPWRMMNEWGIPQIEIFSLLYQYLEKMKNDNEHVPAICVAGGFTMEDQMFKGLAFCAPYTKLIGMARSPIAAAMVGKTIGRSIESGQIPVYIERFGSSIDEIFISAPNLKNKFGNRFEEIPTGALGIYTYTERLAQGLQQLMCGSRKFGIEYITRDDIAAITPEAAKISNIRYVMDSDKEEVETILSS
jgi:glutamate synthase domain-containing protein 2